MSASSRYRPDGPSDYSHRFHAGNVGDVWKHCVLVEVLRAVRTASSRVSYVESHAGDGTYALAPTGEWSEGIGRLAALAGPVPAEAGAVDRYLADARALGVGGEAPTGDQSGRPTGDQSGRPMDDPRGRPMDDPRARPTDDPRARPTRYPGSPIFARRVLGAEATLALWERDEGAAARLRAALGADAAATVTCADGLGALPDAVRAREDAGDAVVALVDPPFSQKPDWIAVPDALAAAATATRAATLLLWYPVKSLTRPNAMIARLKSAGVSATVAELITTPLEHQRQRLNGSGVVLVRPPAGTLAAIASAAPTLGAHCATRPGAWSFRLVSW